MQFSMQSSKSKMKICDIYLLPLCRKALHLHSLRANFIAHQWRSSLEPENLLGEPVNNGWTGELEPKLLGRVIPADIKKLFVDLEYEEYSEDGNDNINED